MSLTKKQTGKECVSWQTWNPEWGDPPQHEAVLLTAVAQDRVDHHPHFQIIYSNHEVSPLAFCNLPCIIEASTYQYLNLKTRSG